MTVLQSLFYITISIVANAVALRDTLPEIPSNVMATPPGNPGPCRGTMSNGKPCVIDLLGYPIDIYRDDWSNRDRDVFWTTQFVDTGKLKTVPTFPGTGIGFKKVKMPEEMWEKILDYYHSLPDTLETHVAGYINNQPNRRKAREAREHAQHADANGKGTGKMGMAEAVTYIREFTGPERDMILSYMTSILEEWIGGPRRPIKLQYTSIYGMRIYTNGSMLMNHCDRADTHAISAILNIMQEGIREPWPLSIMGSDGKTHEVIMEAGDMVLYESARLTHGRPQAFQGDRYCNGFVHMRPSGADGVKWASDIQEMHKVQNADSLVRKREHVGYNELRQADWLAMEREEREDEL